MPGIAALACPPPFRCCACGAPYVMLSRLQERERDEEVFKTKKKMVSLMVQL